VTSISTGELDEVDRWIELAERAPAPGPSYDGFGSGAAAAGCLRSIHRWLIGDVGACREAAANALALGGEPSPWDAVTLTWLGSATYWLGDRDEGIALLEDGLARARAAAIGPPAVACLGILALIHFDRGELDAARARATAAVALAEESGRREDWLSAHAHSVLGSLLLGEARADEASAALERGLELARRGSGPLGVAHATLALAQARQDAGDRDGARALLADARRTVEACPDPGPLTVALLERAEHRLRIAPSNRSTTVVAPEEFSEREIAVLRLLASQLSQREIGSELFISFNTVKSHSKNIFRKLGVSQRADAVRRARELQLL
jgi:LuxR family maltose regulon positive regulatory protein